ncbi:MAG: ATP-binding protein [Verrucomicrobiia bacterium]
MYIHEFRVRNYMIHQDTEVLLQPLTVLVGPNGGGKSAFFDSILNFSMLSRGNIREAYGPYPFSFRATLYRGASLPRIGFKTILSKSQDDADRIGYEIDYSQNEQGNGEPTFMISHEKLRRIPSNEVIFDRSDPDHYPITKLLRLENDRSLLSSIRLMRPAQKATLDPMLEYVTQQISRFNKFRLEPFSLANPSRLPDVTAEPMPASMPRIGYHGEDLASTLYFLSQTNHPSLEKIRQKVRELVPEFEDFEFSTVGTDRIAFAVKYSDQRGTVPSVRLSSGMLTYIGLIALVSTPNRPSVLMIEEPENGLTPQAVKAFYDAVRQLAFSKDTTSQSQILISSHSPFVICEAWNGDDRNFIHQVRVADGKAIIRNFSAVIKKQEVPLAKVDGKRGYLGLKTAEEVMSGRFSE